jgi:TetR/AcrR family transcriptional regulator, mexCD-oprJ operon repressor
MSAPPPSRRALALIDVALLKSYSGVHELIAADRRDRVSATAATREGAPRLRADARRNIERILDAAEACFARDPDASMGDIAAEAGLGRVTIYGHFASRQVLIEAVVHRVLAAADAALDEVDLSGDAAAALERLVDATWRVTLRSSSLLVAAEKALPSATVRQAYAGGLEERVRTFIASRQAGGAFRSDLSADWLVGMFHAIVHAAATEIDAGRLDPGEASSTISSTMLAILTCQPSLRRSGTTSTQKRRGSRADRRSSTRVNDLRRGR